MAKPVIFLCSDEAEGITGERIIAIDFDIWLKARSNSLTSKATAYAGTMPAPWEATVRQRIMLSDGILVQ